MWSTMAEEVKIVNDCMTCFREWDVQKEVKECRLIEYWILVLKNCNFSLKNPWKVHEICLSEAVRTMSRDRREKKNNNKRSENKTRAIYERGGGPNLSLAPSRFWHHFVVHDGTIRELSNNDVDGNGDGNKAMSLDWQINNSAHASRFFVHFFAVTCKTTMWNFSNFTSV